MFTDNMVVQTIRSCICRILRPCIRAICGIPIFWRRSICGCLLLCCICRGRCCFISVKVHVLVTGETFQAHETFIQKLKLRIEQHSAENSNIILVFCPVVSRIGTDMEAAMARVTEDKHVILVFMHHCHNPSHMTNTTVQPSESKIVQVVHCAFLENKGLLECKENNQAVAMVHSKLMKYK